MVDRAALEMRSTGNRTGGSNPSLSAIRPATFPIDTTGDLKLSPGLVTPLSGLSVVLEIAITQDPPTPFKSFLDARRQDAGSILDTDLCIIGSGAAGITIAREFVGTGVRVCLLEAGGFSPDLDVANLSVIDNLGLAYPDKDAARSRIFGGTTNLWGGHCVPLQPIDFEKLDWMEYSGWPYAFADLLPYYQRAHSVLGLGRFEYDAALISEAVGLERFPFDPPVVETVISRYNPVKFGSAFGGELDAAPNVSVVIYAEVSRLNLLDAGGALSTASIVTLAGNEFKVSAKYFVLAAGGIENPRILLLSNHQRSTGLGNHSGFVGRLFQEHIWYPSGLIFASGRHATALIRRPCQIRFDRS